MEETRSVWKKWGIQPKLSTKHRYSQQECPNCRFESELDDFLHYIVGFTDRLEYQKPTYVNNQLVGYEALGSIIIECPNCFELSECHAPEHLLHSLDRMIKKNSGYLKVEGVYEDFQAMLVKREGE